MAVRQVCAGVRRALQCLVVASFLGGTLHAQLLPAQARPEDLKAAFIYNFILFTTWPPDSPAASGSVRVCFDAGSPIRGPFLAVKSRLDHQNRAHVRGLDAAATTAGCDVLVIDATDPGRRRLQLMSVSDAPVLVVADGDDHLAEGAEITLALDNDTMRFDVDADAIRRARLSLSSQLLHLARRYK